MRLVQPGDTDPVTFALIQREIAYADRNEQLLNQYWKLTLEPKPPRLPGESEDECVMRYARYDPIVEQAKQDREHQAIEKARARVAKNPNAKKNTGRQDDPWNKLLTIRGKRPTDRTECRVLRYTSRGTS